MEAQTYLKDRLENCSKYELTESDTKIIDAEGIENFIIKTITRKKFRKWSIPEETKNNILNTIKKSISKNEPIKFTFPFGGYKLWRIKSEPEVDWAEFFTIAYYTAFVSPIAQAYKPGVLFSFSSDDAIIERMNNIPVEKTERYYASFQKLLDHFNKYYPENMKFEIVRVKDMYTKEEFNKELAINYDKILEEYPSWPEDKKSSYLKSSELNFCINGVEDLSEKEDIVKKRVKEGSIYHDAYCSMDKRKAFVRGKDKIVIFCTRISNAIPLGTTKASITKFWTGFGVLETKKDSYKEIVLSPKQLEEFLRTKYQKEKVNLIDMKNFSEILINEKN